MMCSRIKPREQFWRCCIYLGTTTRPFTYSLTLSLLILHSGLVPTTLVLRLQLARSAIHSGFRSNLQGTDLTSEELGPSGVSYHPSPPRSISSHKRTLSLNALPRDDIAHFHLTKGHLRSMPSRETLSLHVISRKNTIARCHPTRRYRSMSSHEGTISPIVIL